MALPCTSVADADTVTVSSYSSSVSLVGVSVKLPVICADVPFGIVLIWFVTGVKSTTLVPSEPATATVTTMSSP